MPVDITIDSVSLFPPEQPFPAAYGALSVRINGRLLPLPRYEHGVRLSQWLIGLSVAARALTNGANSYTLLAEDQGDPDYRFERDGETVYLSIVASPIMGSTDHPAWQRVAFSLADLSAATAQAVESFAAQLLPQHRRAWQQRLHASLAAIDERSYP